MYGKHLQKFSFIVYMYIRELCKVAYRRQFLWELVDTHDYVNIFRTFMLLCLICVDLLTGAGQD